MQPGRDGGALRAEGGSGADEAHFDRRIQTRTARRRRRPACLDHRGAEARLSADCVDLDSPRSRGLNRFFATDLCASDAEFLVMNPLVRAVAQKSPTRMARLKDQYLWMRSRRIADRFNT